MIQWVIAGFNVHVPVNSKFLGTCKYFLENDCKKD